MTLGDLALRLRHYLEYGDLTVRVRGFAHELGDLTVRTFDVLLGGKRNYWRRRGRNLTASHRRF
jgi:hypothetical protein